MSSETNFRIIIIDDNPAIHQDFIKILTIFVGAIMIGLIGVFLVSYFNKDVGQTSPVNTNALNTQTPANF